MTAPRIVTLNLTELQLSEVRNAFDKALGPRRRMTARQIRVAIKLDEAFRKIVRINRLILRDP